MSRRQLPERRINPVLHGKLGQEVVKIEVLPIREGQTITVAFEGADSPEAQGIWLATEGLLRLGEHTAPQFVLWQDHIPHSIELTVEKTDGQLHFYNVWKSTRHAGHDSLAHTSGMVVESLDGGWRRYSCNDYGWEPDFRRLVFRIQIT